jgi:hypothetical protein
MPDRRAVFELRIRMPASTGKSRYLSKLADEVQAAIALKLRLSSPIRLQANEYGQLER